MNLTVIDHPLTRHYPTVLRNKDTNPQAFRAAARGLTYTLVIEATKRLPLRQFEIETPTETEKETPTAMRMPMLFPTPRKTHAVAPSCATVSTTTAMESFQRTKRTRISMGS